ncbi:MFS transporter [Nocardioides terrisoli]|uniref:MFS transporter n=1 Tax=Nocardioides terrisoli TaxID=3388267 RepID=UPI00287BA36B|nr:MFS transporter [Nocardioides marmorisolisilvae]
MTSPATATTSRTGHVLLALAAVAVAFAAADTYVVVLSLPEMMASAGLSIDQLQRAAPIISGFLLGYVAMLPLIGRIADVRGRLPVLVGSLLVFAFGSLVTAASYDLASLVVGRFLQGLGGGGLVPVTLALVADLYPVERRGVPLGVVGAVQELGSVLGPLYGAAVLAVGGWRDIFWINLTVGLVLAAAVAATRSVGPPGTPASPAGRRGRVDIVGLVLGALALAGMLLVMRQPTALVTSVRWGGPFVPFTDGGSIWMSPIGVATIALAVVLLGWLLASPWSAVDRPAWRRSLAETDLVGAMLLAVALAGVILAFATADPQVQVFSAAGPWYLALAALSALAFWWHNRRARHALVPRGSLAQRPAWGAIVVSFFIGAALIAALVDIPIFARVSVYGDSQVRAALVLVEFLLALPVGAVLGGFLIRRLPTGAVTAVGLLLSAVGFELMSRWDEDALHHPSSSVVLALTGLGFGLALAPVNAALLASTAARVHGVTSALLVVARMVGMLVGISALTTTGLHRYYVVQSGFPSPGRVCGDGRTRCDAYTALLQHAGIEQLQTVFVGAGVCAAAAAVLALATFRGSGTGGATRAELLRTVS